jgi:diphthamide biosynthesis methyltransferase
MVESSSDEILNGAADVNIAFLVVGDPFGLATFSYGPLFGCPSGSD